MRKDHIMSNSTKGYRIWHNVTESGLTEIYEVAGQMPLKQGQRVVWHACSATPEGVTECGIQADDVVDPGRLTDYARFECAPCRLKYGATTWDENMPKTLTMVTQLADRTNGHGRFH